MKNITKSLSAVLSAILVSSSIAMAAPTSSELQNQLQQDKSALKKAQTQRQDLEAQIEKLDQQIEDTMDKVEDNKNQITKTQNDIKNSEQEIKKASDDIENEKVLYNKRIRNLYMNGTTGYLEVILDSEGIGDFISRVEAIKSVMDYDKKVIKDFKERQVVFSKKKDELNSQNTRLLALKADNEKKLDELKNAKNDQSKLIAEAKKQERLLVAKVDESQAQVNAAIQQVNAIRNSAPKYTPSRGSAPISSNAVLAYASNFLGTPYVWGGTSPSPGFDCSGFTQYVYAHFGVRLGRTTYDQIKDGTGVSKSELQPGDLVFFGYGGSPSHMGIYVGNGAYIHAPRTGDVVKISSLDNRRDFITGRRVQ